MGPKISVEQVYSNRLPKRIQIEQKQLEGQYADIISKNFTIEIGQLYPSQQYLYTDVLEGKRTGEIDYSIVRIIEYKGYYLIDDGHHTIADLMSKGITTVTGWLLRFREETIKRALNEVLVRSIKE